jgi:hypothetical protein
MAKGLMIKGLLMGIHNLGYIICVVLLELLIRIQ